MRKTEIKTNVSQLDTGVMEYKNKTTAFPPNCQTDQNMGPLDDAQILNDLKKHLKQAFPRHQEPDDLIRVIAGFDPANSSFFPEVLDGGISAGEALVFWLGGFSSDPKYPISGEGGPSYRIQSLGNDENRTLDPIETREWVYPFEITQLAPREEQDSYFDDSNERFVEYRITINGVAQTRRINFWQYTPRKSQQPYLYFDTSRHPAAVKVGTTIVSAFDPPAATDKSPFALHVHALKKASDSAGTDVPIEFVNPDKFQIIHCGDDDAWDEPAFERMSAHGVGGSMDPAEYLLFPTGPFIGEVADTIVNFTSETKDRGRAAVRRVKSQELRVKSQKFDVWPRSCSGSRRLLTSQLSTFFPLRRHARRALDHDSDHQHPGGAHPGCGCGRRRNGPRIAQPQHRHPAPHAARGILRHVQESAACKSGSRSSMELTMLPETERRKVSIWLSPDCTPCAN